MTDGIKNLKELCLIWYTYNISSNTELKCGFKVWTSWFVDWIKEKAQPGFIPTTVEQQKNHQKELSRLTIPCVNSLCSKNINRDNKGDFHELTHSECLKFLTEANNTDSLNRFLEIMLKIISIQQQDFRKCPK